MSIDIQPEFLELLDCADSAIIIIEPQTETILSVNKAAFEIYGYTKSEMLGMPVSKLTVNSENGKHMNGIDNNSNGKTKVNKLKAMHKQKNGNEFFVEINATPINFRGSKALIWINRNITEKKKTEEVLSVSESRYKALVEQQTEMITRWLPDGKFTYVNDVFCKFYDKPKEYFLGRSYTPPMPDEDIQKFKGFFAKLTPENPVGDFTHKVFMPNGEYKWLKWTDTIIMDDNGNIIEYQSVGRDITEIKLAEQRLKESEERYKRLVENVNVINWEFDETNKKFLYISPLAEKLLGYTIEEWYERGFWYNHLHPDDRDRAMNYSKEKAIAGEEYELEYRFMAADGSFRWFCDITSVSYDYNDKKKLYGIYLDITEQKLTEQSLRKSELRLTAHINTLPNVVFYESGSDKRFLTENVFDLLGYPADYLMEDYGRFEKLIFPEDLKIIKKAQDDWISGNSKTFFSCEFRVNRKDGEEVWLEDHMFRTKLEDNKEYHSGVLIDITERKRVEEKIRDSLKEKELLIKEIHHRVKNNLQVVSSLLKLQAGYVKDDEARTMMLESQNRVQSMALVHQKLYQSHNLSKIDFKDYIQQLLFHLFIVFKAKTSEIKLNMKTELLKIGVDTAVPCGLIINELVSNSLKHAFINQGGEDCHIDIELKATDNAKYELIVSDNGIGFPENINFRETASLGLQLVITLVNQLDGTIQMENKNGTKFILTFSNIDYKERL